MTSPRPEWLKSSTIIFFGEVLSTGSAAMLGISPAENLAVVRASSVLRTDPVLGDLRGQSITVQTRDAGVLKERDLVLIFAWTWIVGGGIAVHEIGHLYIDEEEATACVR